MSESIKILELSDGLAQLAKDLDQFSRAGLTMDGETVASLVKFVRHFHGLARKLENEISRSRWNDLVRKEQRVAAIAAELNRPGSNVKLFPGAPRRFSDGWGGAS